MLAGRIYLLACPLAALLFYLSATAEDESAFTLPQNEHGKRRDEGLAAVFNG
jgi:hypothetical protein